MIRYSRGVCDQLSSPGVLGRPVKPGDGNYFCGSHRQPRSFVAADRERHHFARSLRPLSHPAKEKPDQVSLAGQQHTVYSEFGSPL
jgi:hypothetical protein